MEMLKLSDDERRRIKQVAVEYTNSQVENPTAEDYAGVEKFLCEFAEGIVNSVKAAMETDDSATLIGPMHVISTDGGNPTACPNCGAPASEWEVRNYFAGMGDIHCKKCGAYVRMYDAS